MDYEIIQRNSGKNGVADISAVKESCWTLLVGAREAATMLGISRTNWLTRYQMGQTPEPVRLGRRVLWRVAELRAWVDAGCPARYNWTWKGAEV